MSSSAPAVAAADRAIGHRHECPLAAERMAWISSRTPFSIHGSTAASRTRRMRAAEEPLSRAPSDSLSSAQRPALLACGSGRGKQASLPPQPLAPLVELVFQPRFLLPEPSRSAGRRSCSRGSSSTAAGRYDPALGPRQDRVGHSARRRSGRFRRRRRYRNTKAPATMASRRVMTASLASRTSFDAPATHASRGYLVDDLRRRPPPHRPARCRPVSS